jgi:hypothetical protein
VRAALRALPFLTFEPAHAETFLQVLHGLSAAWTIARYPQLTDYRTGAAVALADSQKETRGIERAMVVIAGAPKSKRTLSASTRMLQQAIAHAEGTDAVQAFDLALIQDLNDLADTRSPSLVTGLPLWPADPPDWAKVKFLALADALFQHDVGWKVWAQWYMDRVVGAPNPESHDLVYVDVPARMWAKGPREVNAWIDKQIQLLEPEKAVQASSIPEIPKPGPGPQFQISEDGSIDRAPVFDVEPGGNDVKTVDRLLPLVLRCASDLQSRLSRNEFPELLVLIEQYRVALQGYPSADWGEIWGLGVMLQNAASSAERQIAQRILPPLEDPAKAALDSLLTLHGPLVLATRAGAELSAAAQAFAMTREEQADLRSASEQIGEQLRSHHEVITPRAAASVIEAISSVGEGKHPERGSVYALATIRNVAVVLIGGAAAATPALIGALLGSTVLGAVFGAPLTLLAVETVKKSPAFNALVTQLGARLDSMSDIELRNWFEDRARRLAPFRAFVVSNEVPLRKIAGSTNELKWMLRYIDFIVGENSGAAATTRKH